MIFFSLPCPSWLEGQKGFLKNLLVRQEGSHSADLIIKSILSLIFLEGERLKWPETTQRSDFTPLATHNLLWKNGVDEGKTEKKVWKARLQVNDVNFFCFSFSLLCSLTHNSIQLSNNMIFC